MGASVHLLDQSSASKPEERKKTLLNVKEDHNVNLKEFQRATLGNRNPPANVKVHLENNGLLLAGHQGPTNKKEAQNRLTNKKYNGEGVK